jgi:hypothetical protein
MTENEKAQKAADELMKWFPMVDFSALLPFRKKRINRSKFLKCCASYNENLPISENRLWDFPKLLEVLEFDKSAGLSKEEYKSLIDRISSPREHQPGLDLLAESASLIGTNLSKELNKICEHDQKLTGKITEEFIRWREENAPIGIKRENKKWTFFIEKKENSAANLGIRHTSPNVFTNLWYLACKAVRLTQIGVYINSLRETKEVDGTPILQLEKYLKLKGPSPYDLFRRYNYTEGSDIGKLLLEPFCPDIESADKLERTNISTIGIYVTLYHQQNKNLLSKDDYEYGSSLIEFLRLGAGADEDGDEADINSYCLDLALETYSREDKYKSIIFSITPIPDKYVSSLDGDRFLQFLVCAARERRVHYHRIKNDLSNKNNTFTKSDDQKFRNARELLIQSIKNSPLREEKPEMINLQNYLENAQWTSKAEIVQRTLLALRKSFHDKKTLIEYLCIKEDKLDRIDQIFAKAKDIFSPEMHATTEVDKDEGDEIYE